MDDKSLNTKFYDSTVNQIDGWLHKITALITMEILSFQERNENLGSIIEIGVYKGKYFSILARSCVRTNSILLGIDTFTYSNEKEVHNNLKFLNENNNIILLKEYSNRCNPEKILKIVKSYPRFISVDGSHDYDEVYLDLILSEKIINTAGIIAVDDFINPLTLGVNEAVHKFFNTPKCIVPIAYISNKLFLAHRSFAQEYKNFIEINLLKYNEEVEVQSYINNGKIARHMIEQKLFNNDIIVCF